MYLILPDESDTPVAKARSAREENMKLVKNMGLIDRGIRIALVVAVAVLFLLGKITGVAVLVIGVLAVIFLITSFLGVCPLYIPFGISTRCKK